MEIQSPVRRDRDKRRANSSFTEAKQETDGSEALEVLRRCQAHTNATPYDTIQPCVSGIKLHRQKINSHCNPDQLCQAQPTHEVDEGILRNKLTWTALANPVMELDRSLTNIENARAPRVLRCIHLQICDQPCDRSIAQALLVQILAEEYKAHLLFC